MKNRFGLILISVIAIMYAGCDDNPVSPAVIDRGYFPLEAGRYIVYQVDSITFNNFDDSSDTAVYQIREFIDTILPGSNNDTLYRIERSRRESETDSWQIIDVWSASYTSVTAEKVEENLRFIKLHLPVVEGKNWAGNAYILPDESQTYLADWEYEYELVNAPVTFGSLTFDSTVTVQQFKQINAIENIHYWEMYAYGIGMIQKSETNIETQPGDYPDGYKLLMTAIEHN